MPVVYGGGAVLPFNVYTSEISTFNATATKATFTPYLPNVDSTIGLSGFLRDDFTCLQNDGSCSGDCPQPNCYPGPLPDDYAANDIPVSAQTISVWAISGVGQPFSGNFIQIPSMGYGVAIPVVNPAVSKNGGATLSDNDLCGIFSGKLTDFSQITDAGVIWSGPITVTYYASQGQGITFTLTDHLNTVCNSSNSNIMFTAQFSFASEFSSNHVPVPSNFVALSGSAGIADYLAVDCLGRQRHVGGWLSHARLYLARPDQPRDAFERTPGAHFWSPPFFAERPRNCRTLPRSEPG